MRSDSTVANATSSHVQITHASTQVHVRTAIVSAMTKEVSNETKATLLAAKQHISHAQEQAEAVQAAALARAEQGEDDDGSADDDQHQGSSAVTGALAQRALTAWTASYNRIKQLAEAAARGRHVTRPAVPMHSHDATQSGALVPISLHLNELGAALAKASSKRRSVAQAPNTTESSSASRAGGAGGMPSLPCDFSDGLALLQRWEQVAPSSPISAVPCSDRESRAADTGQCPWARAWRAPTPSIASPPGTYSNSTPHQDAVDDDPGARPMQPWDDDLASDDNEMMRDAVPPTAAGGHESRPSLPRSPPSPAVSDDDIFEGRPPAATSRAAKQRRVVLSDSDEDGADTHCDDKCSKPLTVPQRAARHETQGAQCGVGATATAPRSCQGLEVTKLLVTFPPLPQALQHADTISHGPRSKRAFKLQTNNHERHLIAADAIYKPPPPRSGLVPTAKGPVFMLSPASTNVKAFGASIFGQMLSDDRPITQWLGGLSSCKWQQSRTAAVADDAASETHRALCSVSGTVEEGADEPDAIGDEIFDPFDGGFDDHAHGDAEPALHAAPPHLPGDDGVPRAVDAPPDSLPTHRVPHATPRSGLSRRSTVREIGEWVAVTLCQANEDRRARGVTFSELKATALGPASVTASAAGQGRVPTLSAHRLFLGALWMANAHNIQLALATRDGSTSASTATTAVGVLATREAARQVALTQVDRGSDLMMELM